MENCQISHYSSDPLAFIIINLPQVVGFKVKNAVDDATSILKVTAAWQL